MERMVAIETGVVATIGNVDVDWFEDDDSHTFKFNLPGLRTTDVTVQLLSENILQVSGVRPPNHIPISQSYGAKWHAKERPSGAFRRTFQLPDNVRVGDVRAIDVDGVLVIKVPKKSFVRTIPIY